jgi:hypothetical protein
MMEIGPETNGWNLEVNSGDGDETLVMQYDFREDPKDPMLNEAVNKLVDDEVKSLIKDLEAMKK